MRLSFLLAFEALSVACTLLSRTYKADSLVALQDFETHIKRTSLELGFLSRQLESLDRALEHIDKTELVEALEILKDIRQELIGVAEWQ